MPGKASKTEEHTNGRIDGSRLYYEMSPSIDVMINQVKVATIPFTIGVTFAAKGLELFLTWFPRKLGHGSESRTPACVRGIASARPGAAPANPRRGGLPMPSTTQT